MMRKSIEYIASNKILPFCGWGTILANNPAFHAGLLAFNPFGILSGSQTDNTRRTKSPKDFNINKLECNSGYIHMGKATLKGLNKK